MALLDQVPVKNSDAVESLLRVGDLEQNGGVGSGSQGQVEEQCSRWNLAKRRKRPEAIDVHDRMSPIDPEFD